MKTFSLSCILLLLVLVSFAQDVNYTGPAKMYVKSFWDNVYRLKEGKGGSASNLERQLKSTKEKDPAYNTAAMEAEFAIWKEKARQTDENKLAEKNAQQLEQKQGQDALQNSVKLNSLLTKLFKETNLQVGHNNLEFAKPKIEDYKATTEQVLGMDLTKNPNSVMDPQDFVRYIQRFGQTMDLFVERKESLIKDVTNVGEFEPAYYELQLYQAYWNAAQKIYPSQPEFKANYERITGLINKYGNLDQIKKVADKNKTDKIKYLRLPEAIAKDAELEKILTDGFNKKYGSVYKGTALKAVLTQDGWTIERNSLTGNVTGRNRTGKLAYKGNDGKCYLLAGNIFIYQAYIGSSFSNSDVIYNGLGGEEMLCENVK